MNHVHRIADVIAELQPLIGARIQRVDVLSASELVLELRCPGRTLRLLISVEAGCERVYLVDRRPARREGGVGLQGRLRKHMVGRPLCALALDDATIRVDVPALTLLGCTSKSARGFSVTTNELERAPADLAPLPDRFERSEAIAAELGPRADAERERVRRRQMIEPLRSRLKNRRRLIKKLAATAASSNGSPRGRGGATC